MITSNIDWNIKSNWISINYNRILSEKNNKFITQILTRILLFLPKHKKQREVSATSILLNLVTVSEDKKVKLVIKI